MKYSAFFLSFALLHCTLDIRSQDKRDYQWIMGGNGVGGGLFLDFNSSPVDISFGQTGIIMEGSNTSMSDKNGNLLFYSNGCRILNSKGEVMENGDTINPGIIQGSYCSSGSGSPLRQGVIAIPSSEGEDIYYVLNLDFAAAYSNSLAPMRLFYQKIDMERDSGFGAVVLKNQIAVFDTFSRGNIQACKHSNGKDWWVIVPKSHSNCYFVIPVTAEGIQPAQLKCSGKIWNDNDSGAQVTFSPNGEKYIRFNGWNGLNIFDFNNLTGDLSNPTHIDFSGDTINYISGVAVSANSRYLYVCARKKIYQFDLKSPDINSSKLLLGVWDGYQNPFPTIFYLAALAPDGKIYISNTSSTYNLHVINKPNCPGFGSELVQHGIVLPGYNFATIPNLPHYNILTTSYDCDSVSSVNEGGIHYTLLSTTPNPTSDITTIFLPNSVQGRWLLKDISGRNKQQGLWEGDSVTLSVEDLPTGLYIFQLQTKDGQFLVSKVMVQK